MIKKAILVAVSLALFTNVGVAHPGGVDKNGCHVDSTTGQKHCHPERAKRAKRDPKAIPKAGDEGVFYGPFVAIVDGDTFKAKVQGVVMDFRLESVDAPEHDQPYGLEAKRSASLIHWSTENSLSSFLRIRTDMAERWLESGLVN